MFPQSSQRRYWIFSDENDLTALREKTNAEFIQKHGASMTVSYAIWSSKLTMYFVFQTFVLQLIIEYYCNKLMKFIGYVNI